MGLQTKPAQRWMAAALSTALLASPATADEQTVELRSGGGYQTQRLPDGTREVELIKQLDGNCRFSRSWGYDLSNKELWVDQGCAGRFKLSGEFSNDNGRSASNTGVAIAAVAAIAGLALLASHKDRDRDREQEDSGWESHGRQLRSGGGLCLDIRGQVREGAPAIVFNCNKGANQRFAWGRDGELRVGGLCLDVENANRNNGAGLIAYRCNGDANQRWESRGNQIRSRMNGKCLDVRDGRLRSGQAVQLWDCTGRENQRWWW
jgi:Ricin-type beta-trefoil lectin domain